MDSSWPAGTPDPGQERQGRLRRAAVGFGQGASAAQLYVAVSDLTKTNSPPFTELNVNSSTGNEPGAVVTLNPYVAAAKFVLGKNPSEKDIQRAGVAIADALAKAAGNATTRGPG